MAGEGICSLVYQIRASQVAPWVKNPPAMQETQVQSPAWVPGWEDPLEEGMAAHSYVLAWTIPRTEEPGGLQSIGSHRDRHRWSDWACTHACQVNNLIYYSFLLGCFGFVELRLILCHLSFEKNNFSGHHSWHFSALLNGYSEIQHAEASLMRRLPWQGEKCHLAEAQVLSKWEFCLRQQKQRTDLG